MSQTAVREMEEPVQRLRRQWQLHLRDSGFDIVLSASCSLLQCVAHWQWARVKGPGRASEP